jgi:rhamnulose-1-phosphate aldolase
MTATPTLESVLAEMGRAGRRLDEIHACEAGAGNISVALRAEPGSVRALFPLAEPLALPVPAPALAGWTVLVTGSGCRLREIAEDPTACVAAITIPDDGAPPTLRTSPGRAFRAPTSEFNSHLAVHQDRVHRGSGDGSGGLDGALAVVHAQPPHLVALSHVWADGARGADAGSAEFSRRIMRWEPETVVQLPEGVGVLPFMVPGSPELQAASVRGLREHRIVLWSKHGVLARSDAGPMKAVDLIEYAETGAMYEILVGLARLATGGAGGTGGGPGAPSGAPGGARAATDPADRPGGLTEAEVRAVIVGFGVRTALW